MKKLLLGLAAALLLTSCHSTGASDGYYFETAANQQPSRPIRVVLYSSMDGIKADYARQANHRALTSNEDLQAYSVINNQGCVIHMIDPKIKYQPEFFGHELTHCLYGEFHPSQNGSI